MLPLNEPSQLRAPPSKGEPRSLTEANAIDIWIARWLRIRRRDLCQRYQCDPRRLYEIWDGSRFPAAQDKARTLFAERHPGIVDRIDFGHHRRVTRDAHPDQLGFFN